VNGKPRLSNASHLRKEIVHLRAPQLPRYGGADIAHKRVDLKIILARSTPILINFFMDGLPLCGAPATTPWHYDAVEERPSTSSAPADTSPSRRHVPKRRKTGHGRAAIVASH
jgi:hypothetical protein